MSVKARIEVDNSELKKGLKDSENQVKKSFDKIKDSAKSSSSNISNVADSLKNVSDVAQGGLQGITGFISKLGPVGKLTAVAIGTIATAVTGVIAGMNKLTGKLNDTAKAAKSVNMTATAYQSLKHACNRAGLELQKVLNIVTKIDYAIVKSHDGEQRYRDAFYDIGLSWRDLEKMSPEKRLNEINDALSKIKETGQTMPDGLNQIFNKRDMQTLNKMTADKGFVKYQVEAEALGLNINPEMLEKAEAYQDMLGDVNEKTLAWLANMESIENITEKLTKLMKHISQNIGNASGKVGKQFQGKFEGIGDVAEDYFKGNNKDRQLNVMQKKALLYALKSKDTNYGGPGGSNSAVNIEISKQLDALSPEEIERQFRENFSNLDLSDVSEMVRQKIFFEIAKIDKRFNANDKNTWVQTKQVPQTSNAINESKALDEAEDLNKALQNRVKSYGKMEDSSNGIINIEKRIADIENRRATKLNSMVKTQLRLNAALANQKTLEDQLKRMKDAGNNTLNDFYADMLSHFTGAKEQIKLLFESLTEDDDEKSGNIEAQLNQALNFQYNKANAMKQQGETEDDFNRRVTAMKPKFSSPEEMLQKDPDAYFKALEGIGNDYVHGKGVEVHNTEDQDALEEAQREYNEYMRAFNKGKKGGQKLPELHLNLDSTSVEENAKNYDNTAKVLEEMKAKEQENTERAREVQKTVIGTQEEVRKLNDRRADLNAQIGSGKLSAQQLQDAKNQIVKIDNEIYEVTGQKEVDNAMKEIDRLKSKRDELKEKLAEYDRIGDTTSRERKDTERQLTLTQNSLFKIVGTDDYKDRLDDIDQLEKKRTALKDRIRKYEEAGDTNSTRVQSTKEQLLDVEKSLGEIVGGDKLDERLAEVAELRKKRDKLQEEIDKLKGNEDQNAPEIEEKEGMLHEIEEQISTKTGGDGIDKKMAELEELQKKKADIEAELKKLSEGGEVTSVEYKGKKEELINVNNQIDDIIGVNKYKQALEEYSGSIEELKAKREKLKKKLKDMAGGPDSTRMAVYGVRLHDLDQQIDEYEKKKKAATEAMNKASKVLANSKKKKEAQEQIKKAKKREEGLTKLKMKITANNNNEELEGIRAERNGDKAKLDMLQRQNILKQMGVKATAENLELYKKELDVLMKQQKALTIEKARSGLQNKAHSKQDDLEMQRAKEHKDEDRIRILKQNEQLRSMGLDPTEENRNLLKDELENLSEVEENINKFNLGKSLKNQADNNHYELMEKSGFGKEAHIQRERENAYQTKGSALTQEEMKMVDAMSAISYEMGNMQMPENREDIVHTNELAERGGFSSSVAVEKQDNTKNMLKVQEKIKELMTENNRLNDLISKRLIG